MSVVCDAAIGCIFRIFKPNKLKLLFLPLLETSQRSPSLGAEHCILGDVDAWAAGPSRV